LQERSYQVGTIKTIRYAGSWYPADGRRCEAAIRAFQEGDVARAEGEGRVGCIVPHAGWQFSGRIAYAALAAIARTTEPDVVFLFGMHLPPGARSFILIDDGLETPLGTLPIARDTASRFAAACDMKVEDAETARWDNTLELQLPFIKYLFPGVSVVAAGISPDEGAVHAGGKAARMSRELNLKPVFVGSTDLTHYGPNYGFTPYGTGREGLAWVVEENDRRMVDAFIAMDGGRVIEHALGMRSACCPGAAAAVISGAREAGAREGTLVEYATSYDVMPGSSFVGYAGVVY
jgi:AmmeMemoRadiSam system protein B